MTNTESLQILIQDVSTSFATMQQEMSSNFILPERDRAQVLHAQVHRLYAAGAYTKAFHACENLVDLLEEVEIQYMYWLEKQDKASVHTSMGQHLDMVTTAPEKIVLEDHIEELEQYKERLHMLTVPEDTWLYRVVYHNLLRLELIFILAIIGVACLLLLPAGEGSSDVRYLVTLLAILGGGVWMLRMTRHVWGVLLLGVLVLVGMLLVFLF